MPLKPGKSKSIKLTIKRAPDDFAKGAKFDEGASSLATDKSLHLTKNLAPRFKGPGSLAAALGTK